MASLDVTDICLCCCEKFNKSTRKPIRCPIETCNYTCCRECFITYVNDNPDDLKCMNCGTEISQSFLVRNVTRKYFNDTFKHKLGEKIFNNEKAYFPEIMDIIKYGNHKEELSNYAHKHYDKEIHDINEQIINLQHKLTILINKKTKITDRCDIMEDTMQRVLRLGDSFTERDLKIVHYQGENIVEDMRIGEYEREGAEEIEGYDEFDFVFDIPTAIHIRNAIFPCSNNDCNGLLSNQYKCEVCQLFTCSRCLELIGTKEQKCEHICKKENIETVNSIKEETKPCPECKTRIYKIDGCDQMWCTKCHVTFSWKTGKQTNARIHNPHYYEWRRKNGTLEREPGDVPGNCNAVPSIRELKVEYTRFVNKVWFSIISTYDKYCHDHIAKCSENYNSIKNSLDILCLIMNSSLFIDMLAYGYIIRYNSKFSTDIYEVNINGFSGPTNIHNRNRYGKTQHEIINIKNICSEEVIGHVLDVYYYRKCNINSRVDSLYRMIAQLDNTIDGLNRSNNELRLNKTNRYKYVKGLISEDCYMKILATNSNTINANTEIIQLYQIVKDYITEILIRFNEEITKISNAKHDLESYITEQHINNLDLLLQNYIRLYSYWEKEVVKLYNLSMFINNKLREVSVTYSISVSLFHPLFNEITNNPKHSGYEYGISKRKKKMCINMSKSEYFQIYFSKSDIFDLYTHNYIKKLTKNLNVYDVDYGIIDEYPEFYKSKPKSEPKQKNSKIKSKKPIKNIVIDDFSDSDDE